MTIYLEPNDESAENSREFAGGAAFIDGQYCSLDNAKISILDLGFIRSDACQDTVSVWKGVFFRLEDHLDRFQDSYQRLRMVCPYCRDEIRSILTELVKLTGFQNAYTQVIMTRGRGPVGSRDPRLCRNNFLAFCVPYVAIADRATESPGLHMIVSGRRRLPPETVESEIKSYHWIDFDLGLLEAYDRGGDTCVLVDSTGNITEGPGFNVFAVQSGKVVTPDKNVLQGITRRTVFELCDEMGIPISASAVSVEQLRGADEVFLSSTAGGVMSVSKVDGRSLASGNHAGIARRVCELY